MKTKLAQVVAVFWILTGSIGCASWRENVKWDAKAEKEHLDPHQEREQWMRQLAEPR
jgi:hypothetical protein